MSAPARLVTALAVLTATTLTVAIGPSGGPASAAEPPALFVSEINPDNGEHDVDGNTSTQDNFEFFELANTTGAPIDLAADGYTLDYNGSVDLTLAADSPSPAVVPAGGALVLWLRYSAGAADGYSSGSPNSFLFDAADFRTHYGIDPATPVVHVEGQPGMANGSVRSVGVSYSGVLMARSTYDPSVPDVDPGLAAHFAAPGAPGTDATIFAPADAPTPGTIDPAQLVAPTPPSEPSAVFVSEVNPDNGPHDVDGHASTQDNFEYFEIANRTDAPIDLGLDGYTLLYNGTVELTVAADSPSEAVIPAGGARVFWLRYSAGAADGYSSGSPNSYLFDADDFRTHYGIDPATPVVHVEGQPGMSNSGPRTIVIEHAGAVVGRSRYEPATDLEPDRPAHFRAPVTGATDATVWARNAAPAPGSVDARQFVAQTVPDQGPPPATDPGLAAPILQVTEVAPDTANVGGADGYEFIEVYNASDEPVNFADYTINYLYIDANAVTNNATLWPAQPADPVIEPGRTLVLWIKNGPNDTATDADFNAAFGSNLTLGVNLVEISAGGMANGGLRGIQVMTNTGHDVSRAYYFNNDQTTATTAIQYAWNPAPSETHLWTPTDPAGSVQTMTALAVPTPGYAGPEQVPGGLVATPADAAAPEIEDLTGTTDAPDTDRVELLFDISDDVLVRTVELTLDTNVDEPNTRLLQYGAPDRYGYGVPAADLYGKRWVEYTVVARDGVHTTVLGPIRIDLVEGEPEPVRLNVSDGQYVGGETRLAATTEGNPAELTLAIDDVPVVATVPSLEASPKFVFEATSTDAFFRNGVKLGEQVLAIFDQGFYDRIETVAADVPVEAVVPGEPLTVGIYAGTKAWPQPDPNENNDDFAAFDPRLALPDGRVLDPVTCRVAGEAAGQELRDVPCPDAGARIGFNDASNVYFTATFDVPVDAFDSRAHVWNTTLAGDGEHTVSATAGADSASRTVVVDNTAPTIEPSVATGALLRGDFTLDATVSDAGAGVDAATATLDGAPIDLPLVTSSLELAPGDHTVEFQATDAIGNAASRSVTFSTADERPSAELGSPAAGATLPAGDVVLTATASSPELDDLTIAFAEGHTFTPADPQVVVSAGTVEAADATGRDGQALTAEQLADMATADGLAVNTVSATALPYHLFTVDVPSDAGADANVRVAWEGSANADAKVLLYVLTTGGQWEEVDRKVTTRAMPTDFTLGGLVPVAGHAADGELTFLVQHSEGFAGAPRSTRDNAVEPFHPDATARDTYDFTIGWESDTQYYNETFYEHQLEIHEFFLDQRDALNLQYVIHTGDIVDEYDQPYQWHNADPAYQMLDDASLPYGVLAGNHDVGGHLNDYSEYSKYFGAARYANNPWYGGSHLDNRGHYDLISANGVDFLMLYMGWAPGDDQIEWMNAVIAEYPERKVWINLHEYMLTTGGLGPIPQRIYDEVVATNSNVFAVSSGHYHDAYTRTDDFDDNADGVADRTVYSMLFDYQGLPEGGLGYIRLLHFDNEGERIVVRTYSPSLDDFDSDDASLNNPPGMQEFEIPYAAVGITPAVKTLSTDAFRADVLTTNLIGSFADIPSGTPVDATWTGLDAGEHGWFVRVDGPYGGTAYSAVRTFTATSPAATVPGAPTASTAVGDGDGVRVTWAAPDDGGSPITHYLVQPIRDGRPSGRAVEGPASSLELDFEDLAAGTYRFTVRAVNAIGASPASAPSGAVVVDPTNTPDPAVPPAFRGIQPTRMFDSRDGAALQPGEPRALQIAGIGAIPGEATGVVVNLTATKPAGPGFVVAWPCDGPRPHASSINYADATIANSIAIELAADGTLCVDAGVSAVDLIADVTGYFLPESPFGGHVPARLLDTRPGETTFDGRFGGAGLLVPGETIALAVGGRGDVPPDAAAVAVNLTATQSVGAGYAVAWPCDAAKPGTSSINYVAGATVANSTVIELADDGTICLEARGAAVHLVADVTGHFGSESTFSGLNPARLLDTRAGGPTIDQAFSGSGPVQPGSALELQVAGRGGVPTDATAAVLNVTVTESQGPGHLTIWDCSGPAPHASSINYVETTTVANAIVVDLSGDGTVCIQPGVSAVEAIADVTAYFR